MTGLAPVIAEGLYSYEIGGSERVGVELALQFRDRGYGVICFALHGSSGPFRDVLEQQNVRCIDLDYTTRPRYIRRVMFQAEVWRALRRERVAALHLHHATSLMLCGIAAKLAGVSRTVVTEHSIFQFQENVSYRRSVARYCRFADDITVVSSGQAEYFQQVIGAPRQRLHVVPNGVKVRSRSPATGARIRSEFKIPPEAFVFLYAGRLNEVKRLPILLRAVALWAPEFRARTRLILAGDGPDREALQELCATLGINVSVTFAGARADVGDVLSAADAFVMSSRTEGLPMALLESMAASVPCVATAVGGIPELLRDGAGLVVPPDSPEQLAMAMQRLVNEPTLRADLARTGLSRVQQHYSLDAVVTRYLGLLGLPERWHAAK